MRAVSGIGNSTVIVSVGHRLQLNMSYSMDFKVKFWILLAPKPSINKSIPYLVQTYCHLNPVCITRGSAQEAAKFYSSQTIPV